MKSIFEFLTIHAEQMPDRPAILSSGCSSMTYGMLAAQVRSKIGYLRREGIARHDRVAVVLPDGAAGAVACLSIMSGAICAPLNPSCTAHEFEMLLSKLNAAAVLVGKSDHSPMLGVATSMGLKVLEWEDAVIPLSSTHSQSFSESSAVRLRDDKSGKPLSPDDVSLLLFTSGTSASPKLVPLTHRNITAAARSIAASLQLTSNDRCQFAMPLHHIHGLSTLFSTIASGGTFIAMSGFSPEKFLACLAEFRPTWYSASPTIHSAILEQAHLLNGDPLDCGLRFIRSASAAIPEQLLRDMERTFGVPLVEAYGMTEASPQIATNQLPPFKRKQGSVGTAAGSEIGIMGRHGKLLSPGTTGEVVIRGDNVTAGYENDADANQVTITDGWLRTGDLGHLDEDGYLFITGRLKEIINRGGEKISPQFVEGVLLEHPAIEQAAVFAVAHPVLGENVAAAIVLRPYFQESLLRSRTRSARERQYADEILEYTATRLAHFEVPSTLVFVGEIPVGSTGKVNRTELAKQLEVTKNGAKEETILEKDTLPRSATERRVSELIEGVLKISTPGINENFFELGGDSLTAMQVIARLEDIFQISFPRNILFERTTAAELAAYIGEHLADLVADGKLRVDQHLNVPVKEWSQVADRHLSVAPASFTQEQAFFIDQLGAGSAYNVSAPLWLSGTLCNRTLVRALNEIVRRHGSLRTTFQFTGDGLKQIIQPPHRQSIDEINVIDANDLIEFGLISESESKSDTDRRLAAMNYARVEAAKPFDLANGPLLRVNLIRIGEDEHLLLLVMHHIVSDGWSTGILYRELKDLYNAYLQNQDSPLGELPFQFGDFAAWQRKRVGEGRFTEQIDYWKKQLAALSRECTFPTDRPRQRYSTFRGAVIETPLAPAIVQRLKHVAESCNATPFMALLAAFKTLLFRHNGQTDCAIGTPMANRTRAEFESLIGFFANTLVLRTDMTGNPTFLELLDRVRTTSLDAAANQEVALERLVEELHLERDASARSLFQVMFAFQNLHNSMAPAVNSTGLAPGKSFCVTSNLVARPFRIDNGTSKFDLTLYVSQTDDGLKATWQYNSDLYREETISSLALQFQTLLAAIAADPDRRLSKLPLVADVDFHKIVAEWNCTEKVRKFKNSFVELFEDAVLRMPENIAVVDGDKQWTYRQLNQRANQIARHLQALGVKPGKLVGACLQRSVEWVAVILGIWKAGGAYLPLDPEYPAQRIDAMVLKSQPSLIICDGTTLHSIKRIYGEMVVCLDDDNEVISQLEKNNLNSIATTDDAAYVMFTSGSNGEPRGVIITHGNVCHYAQSMFEALDVESKDRFLHTASFAFSSSVRQFVVPLASGAACVISSNDERRDPLSLFEMVKRREVTVVDLVASHWMGCLSVLRSIPTRSSLLENSVRLVLSASEPLPASIARDWRRLFNHEIRRINMYGQTETSGIVAMHAISDEDETSSVVPIGKPIANTKAYVLDESYAIAPVGKCGELFVGGSGIASGYLNEAEETSRSFISSPFGRAEDRLYSTGDLARYRADGTIEFVGRKDTLTKIRGYRIELLEVENVLRAHPDVSEAAVVVVKETDTVAHGEQTVLRAFVTLAPRTTSRGSSIAQTLREFVRERLPEHFVPATITVLEQIPRTGTGKIDRIKLSSTSAAKNRKFPADVPELILPALSDSSLSSAADSISESQSILMQVWQSVLQMQAISVDENFFDLGGNSLLAVNVMVRAKELGLHFTLVQFYQNQTISELAGVAEFSEARAHERTVAFSRQLSTLPPKDITVKMRPNASSVLVSVDSLRSFGVEALSRAGLAQEGARIVTEVQLEASMRGQSTHNMISIPRYAKRLAAGKLNRNPMIRVESETGVMARIDGDNGPGQWVGTMAMDVALEKARDSGFGITVVRRSNHFGAAGHYVWEATKRGMIGLCTTNGPLILAPTGGTTPTFGNNPLGVGIPAQGHAPILLDIAMSVATRGKIGLSIAEGQPLSHGWIFDRLGRSSIDLADLAAGLGVPIGGHKGYGLALVMEVLSGVLSGSGFCLDHGRDELHHTSSPDYGHFFLALDPARFMPARDFLARVDRLIEQTKSGELAEGASEILVPGEMEMRARERSLKEGVRIRTSAYRALLAYAKDANLETELELTEAPINV